MFQDIPNRRRRRLALLATIAVTLSACAAVPELGAPAIPHTPGHYAASQSLTAPATAWPSDQWWMAYGDEQLDRLMAEAFAQSPSLAIAQARVAKALALAQSAGAALGPRLTGDASIAQAKQSYNTGVPSAFVPHGWQSTAKIGASLDWQLDLFGKNRALLTAATSDADAARADDANARLTLSTALAIAYADLAHSFADRDAAVDALRVRIDSEALVAARCAAGLESHTALETWRAARANAEAQIIALDESIGLTRNQIAALIGQGPDRGLMIDRPTRGALHAFGLPANLQAELIGHRPDVMAARLAAEASGARIDAATSDFYPNINLSAFIGVQSLGLNLLTKPGSALGNVGPAITLPIFDSGRLQAAYRGTRADYDLAVASYEQTLIAALQDVANSAISIRALDGRLTKSREALAASSRAHELARARYTKGLGNYLDVLSAEDSLIANKNALAGLESRAFTLDVGLVRALGGGFRA